MIYRIAIYWGGKFDHYATEEELQFLRVNAEGRVEKLFWLGCYNEHYGKGAWIDVRKDGTWRDVSDTHKVEWGIQHPLGVFYSNDIAKCKNGSIGIVVVGSPDDFTLLFDTKNIGWCHPVEGFHGGTVTIGNIHENPELLEES
jgi:hypothetical protein